MSKRQVSFTQLLSWGFGLLMLVGIGLVLYLGINSTRQNTQILLSELSHNLMNSVVKRIDGQLQPVEHQLSYLATSLGGSEFGPTDPRATRILFEGALAATPQVMGLMLLNTDRSRIWVDREQRQIGMNRWVEHRSATLSPYLESPPEKEMWLAPVWSPSLNQVVLPLIYPVYRQQQFAGLLVAAIKVDTLSAFVAQLSEQLGVKLFILYDRNKVLAYPGMRLSEVAGLSPGNATGNATRNATRNATGGAAGNDVTEAEPITLSIEGALPSIAQLDDPALQQFWSPDRQRQQWMEVPGVRAMMLDSEQGRLLYLSRQLQRYGEQPWIVGAYLGEKMLPQELRQLGWILGVGSVLMAMVLALVIWISRRIGASLSRTVAGFDRIGQQSLQQIPRLPGSQIREFNRVAHAYNRMLDELRQSEASQRLFGQYVPQAIARELLMHQGQLQTQSCQATVLFCDMEGFTALTQQLGPDQLVAVLNEYFSAIVEVIESHNGVITQFQGDAVLATFNVPLADPKHANQAWRSALEIQQLMAERHFLGHRLSCRIGINTGPLVAGSVGAKERLNYTVHGDAVNLAARLEALNKEYGTRILISEFTADQLTDVELKFVAETQIRGREGTLKVYTHSDVQAG